VSAPRADEAERRTTCAPLGGIDLPTMQKYLNLWYSLSLDLFGGEISLERGRLLRDGPQGAREGGAARGPPALEGTTRWTCRRRQGSSHEDVPLRNAMNEVLRDEYVETASAASTSGTARSRQ
jgi:benzoyl-CoA 2,3-dioxygenase component B